MPEHSAARWATVDGFIENSNLKKIIIKPEPHINCMTAVAGKQEFQYMRLCSIHAHMHRHTKFQLLFSFCARKNPGYFKTLIFFPLKLGKTQKPYNEKLLPSSSGALPPLA